MITWTVNVVLGVYIGILVIFQLPLVMVAQWLVHLLPKQKVRVHIPVVIEVFFPTSIFLSPLSQPQSDQTDEPSICD